jgi:Tol biopolymer transport system component
LLYSSPEQVQSPAWSPQGNQIAWIELIGPTTTVIKILDISSGKTTSIKQPDGVVFDPSTSSGSDLAWLPDGKHLLVLYFKAHSDRGQIGLVRVPGGNFNTLTNDVSAYSQLSVSADGKMLATVLTNVNSSLAYYKGEGGAMISSTPLRITPTSLAWGDEDHLWLITEDVGLSKVERATGNQQLIDTGDLDIGTYINICPNGQVFFIAVPKGEGESRLFRMDQDGSGIAQLTTSGIARAPFCTPDSRKVYFTIRDKVNLNFLSLWSLALPGGTPQKEFEGQASGSIPLSRDAKLAAVRGVGAVRDGQFYTPYIEILDLETHRIVHRLPQDTSGFTQGMPSFSPDGKGFVEQVATKDGNALLYQPIDGSATHLLTNPTHDTLTDFAWSPSGSRLGALQLRQNSDVVLITDVGGKQPH